MEGLSELSEQPKYTYTGIRTRIRKSGTLYEHTKKKSEVENLYSYQKKKRLKTTMCRHFTLLIGKKQKFVFLRGEKSHKILAFLGGETILALLGGNSY